MDKDVLSVESYKKLLFIYKIKLYEKTVMSMQADIYVLTAWMLAIAGMTILKHRV